MNTIRISSRMRWLLLALSTVLVAGCTEIGNMQEQPKYADPYDESVVFGVAAPELDPNAVPIGALREDQLLYAGRVDGELADEFPVEVNEALLLEGQRLYNGFCSPCHGYVGYGDGVISLEGFAPPASFHDPVIRAKPAGHYYDVIVNGQLVMFSYASRIPDPEDRWAIVAYIRALQLSQSATLQDLPEDLQAEFAAAVRASEAAPPAEDMSSGTGR
ncbi:MAG: cytochrome c [Anaerolineae bacterium]|nr:cytochrome c [Anaerolineae bacterium]